MRISVEDITKFLLNFIAEGDFVPDAGCGDCGRLKELKKLKEITAFGVDVLISQPYSGFGINCSEMRAENIDKLPEKFNLIFTAYSFHHFAEPERFPENAKNRLVGGGKLIIIDWKFDAVTDNPNEEYYKASGIEKFLMDAGFKNRE
jgi:SAM-dependent methyltransferase